MELRNIEQGTGPEITLHARLDLALTSLFTLQSTVMLESSSREYSDGAFRTALWVL